MVAWEIAAGLEYARRPGSARIVLYNVDKSSAILVAATGPRDVALPIPRGNLISWSAVRLPGSATHRGLPPQPESPRRFRFRLLYRR